MVGFVEIPLKDQTDTSYQMRAYKYYDDSIAFLRMNYLKDYVINAGSGSIATGGVAQSMLSANEDRISLIIQNTSAQDLFVNLHGETASIANSFKLVSGSAPLEVITNEAVSVFGNTTGQTFTYLETTMS